MKRIVLESQGRLANAILCWANARHVLTQLGLQDDRTIVINYEMPVNCVTFPGAIVEKCKTKNLKTVKRGQIGRTLKDCLWIWEDVYSDFPIGDTIQKIIQTIELSESFASQLGDVANDYIVGIHARFGDYVTAGGEKKSPFIRATNEYFLTVMQICREAMPGTKFFLASDGTVDELEFLYGDDVLKGRFGDPLFDLFALSKCRLIIGSSSTFSTVAALYGNVPLLLPVMSKQEIVRIVEGAK